MTTEEIREFIKKINLIDSANPSIFLEIRNLDTGILTNLIWLGDELSKAEQNYAIKFQEIRARENIKTKADAEIISTGTDEYRKMKELRYLRETTLAMLPFIRRLFDKFLDERQINNFMT